MIKNTRSVFVSHASADAALAKQVVTILESKEVLCWIAPRDITPGSNYNESILTGIEECTAMLLIMSEAANESNHVMVELERAFNYKKVLIPLRVREVLPSKKLEYFISSAQWVDAISSPLSDRLGYVSDVVKALELNVPPPNVEPEKPSVHGRLLRFLEGFRRGLSNKNKSGLYLSVYKKRKFKLLWLCVLIVSFGVFVLLSINSQEDVHRESEIQREAFLDSTVGSENIKLPSASDVSGVYEVVSESAPGLFSEFQDLTPIISQIQIPEESYAEYLSWNSLDRLPVKWDGPRVHGADKFFRKGVVVIAGFGKVDVNASGEGGFVRSLKFLYRVPPVANVSWSTLKTFIKSQVGHENEIGIAACPVDLFTGIALNFPVSSYGKKPFEVDFMYNKESDDKSILSMTFDLSGRKAHRVC